MQQDEGGDVPLLDQSHADLRFDKELLTVN